MKTFNQFQAECWKTHKKVGMKMKGGKLVNDCRPKNEEVQNEGTDDDLKGDLGAMSQAYNDEKLNPVKHSGSKLNKIRGGKILKRLLNPFDKKV